MNQTYDDFDHHAAIRTCKIASSQCVHQLCNESSESANINLWTAAESEVTHETKNIETPIEPMSHSAKTPDAGKMIMPSEVVNGLNHAGPYHILLKTLTRYAIENIKQATKDDCGD